MIRILSILALLLPLLAEAQSSVSLGNVTCQYLIIGTNNVITNSPVYQTVAITNGGFETGFLAPAWGSGNGAGGSVGTQGGGAHTGSVSAFLMAGLGGAETSINQIVTAAPGAVFSFWTKFVNFPANSYVNVVWNSTTLVSLTTSNANWSQTSITLTNGGYGLMSINVGGVYQAKVNIDDVAIQ